MGDGTQLWVALWGQAQEPSTARELARRLSGAGVEVAGSARAARDGLLLVGDDETSAIERLRQLRGTSLGRIVVVAPPGPLRDTGFIFRLRAAGADEVLALDEPQLAETVAARLRRWSAVDALMSQEVVRETSVGRSPAWISLLREIVEVAAFARSAVVLLGESGTGKEHLARLIHALDSRPQKGELVTVDCTTVAPELAASEFFGHERGAFTGATGARDGAFSLANQGTLFLDEVGDLPLTLQAQLLRVIQEGTYKRVGANGWCESRFRLVCATHVELAREVGERRFRLDFFHRIGGWVIRVPPLRERAEDVVPLAQHFMAELLPPGTSLDLTPPVHQFLMKQRYPGNVRELRSLVARLCARHAGPGPLTVGDIPRADLGEAAADQPTGGNGALEQAAGQAALAGMGLKEIGHLTRVAAIRSALFASGDNAQVASRLLKVTDRTVQVELAKRDA